MYQAVALRWAELLISWESKQLSFQDQGQSGSRLGCRTHLLTAAIPAAKLALRETLIRPCFVHLCQLCLCFVQHCRFFLSQCPLLYSTGNNKKGAGIYVQLFNCTRYGEKQSRCVKTKRWVPLSRCDLAHGLQFTVMPIYHLQYFGCMWKLMIWGIFYVSRCSSITVAFYAKVDLSRDLSWNSPRAGPCSPQKSRVPSASRASFSRWPNWPLVTFSVQHYLQSPPLNQTPKDPPPLLPPMFFFLSPFLWGAAWSSMVDLVGCHIRQEVLKSAIIILAEMLGLVRLAERAGSIR